MVVYDSFQVNFTYNICYLLSHLTIKISIHITISVPVCYLHDLVRVQILCAVSGSVSGTGFDQHSMIYYVYMDSRQEYSCNTKYHRNVKKKKKKKKMYITMLIFMVIGQVCLKKTHLLHYSRENIKWYKMFMGKHNSLINSCVSLMVFNHTFNTISVISWKSVLSVEETGGSGEKPPTCSNSLTNFITLCCTPRPDRDSNSQHQWWYALIA